MKAEKDTVRHVAALARLKFNDEEIETLREQMGSILGFVDKLNELEQSDTAAPAQPPELYNVFREDILGTPYRREDMLANAPEQSDGCYRVPKIVE